LKLSQTQINKKAGFRIILQFPQRYIWGIRVPQKYLYVISVLGACSIGNDVTDYPGLSEAFLKRPNYFEVKVNIELLSTGILLQRHS
jgi:hypothetical protein